jgi:hypothetical protein
MAASVAPEEVYLATLTFFCIKPPEHDGHQVPVNMKAFTRDLAIFLLKELKVQLCTVQFPRHSLCVLNSCSILMLSRFPAFQGSAKS